MATVHYLDLPREYQAMDIPQQFMRSFGSQALTRLLTFVDHFQVTNEDYDCLMAIKPQRQNGETEEAFRLRSQLQKVMGKYKHLFYDYSVYYPTPKQIKRARKQSLKAA